MATFLDASDRDRITAVATLLHRAARPVKILRAIAWPDQVKADFFAQGASALPQVEYPAFDPQPVLDLVHAARRDIFGGTAIDTWLERQASALETGARMLAGIGTAVFFEHSRRAYGEPTTPMRFDTETPLDLARQIQTVIQQLDHINLDIAPPEFHAAEVVARQIETAVGQHFGDSAPEIQVVETLSANALASASRIRLRQAARFTDRDAAQLIHHEAYIHVGTALNGQAQTALPILAAGHPGTTRTQEGLAVFAEIISGTIELNRFQRLADRVFAIQMAVEGADFLQVYQYFLERTDQPDQAFESARRVFRGGVMTGGAPFTKDVVYLYGLLQVSTAIRAMFSAGRADCLLLLFCGKLDIYDLPALAELTAAGLCELPRFVPPWVSDPRYLLALLTYSTFMNQIESERALATVKKLLEHTPIVELPARSNGNPWAVSPPSQG
ncbi:flavohemoglobin expression-modulating QEGLA motif protein [Nodosilinea sp. PGN35]|uniref:flavohemoglobin expression-modulating QEGLA motif protein n=1 Tax=Nodosilinea sp. PGN35 TaxID=3020489 RepID=UPI0023B28DD5|nr:flavohemoglobin expression-modulating QEGLA motif protein [Nodosilinea sp. TSF1-S3]MDF0367223.1 flavohemoglobin expression-modulating QEGLA motif protein [Nodosilinea sp. TSF1-S3]